MQRTKRNAAVGRRAPRAVVADLRFAADPQRSLGQHVGRERQRQMAIDERGAKRRADGQLSGVAGELFVAAELLRREIQASLTLGNAKAIDIFALRIASTYSSSSTIQVCHPPTTSSRVENCLNAQNALESTSGSKRCLASVFLISRATLATGRRSRNRASTRRHKKRMQLTKLRAADGAVQGDAADEDRWQALLSRWSKASEVGGPA